MKRKILKGFLYSVSVLGLATAGWSAWWMYQNNNYQLSRVAQPAKNIKITKQDQKTEGVSYTPSVELTSVEQMEKARQDTSQPLYLRSFLSIPNLGINLQVFEGTSDRVLTYGAGTIKANQNPDNIGNYALAAHNFYDQSYGTGFSILQSASNIVGSNAYLSDGDYVYTYKLAEVTNIYKDDSMIYTEDDFPNQLFQDKITQLAPDDLSETVVRNKIWNKNGTYTESSEGKEFKYGKLLTLYTCYLEPSNRTLSYNRIIVTGVQINKQKISEAPDDVKNLFIDPRSKSGELSVTNNSTVPKTETQAAENSTPKTDSGQKDLNFKVLQEGDKYNNIIEYYVLPRLKKDPNFIWKLFYGGMALFLVPALTAIFIPSKKKNKKRGNAFGEQKLRSER